MTNVNWRLHDKRFGRAVQAAVHLSRGHWSQFDLILATLLTRLRAKRKVN